MLGPFLWRLIGNPWHIRAGKARRMMDEGVVELADGALENPVVPGIERCELKERVPPATHRRELGAIGWVQLVYPDGFSLGLLAGSRAPSRSGQDGFLHAERDVPFPSGAGDLRKTDQKAAGGTPLEYGHHIHGRCDSALIVFQRLHRTDEKSPREIPYGKPEVEIQEEPFLAATGEVPETRRGCARGSHRPG